MMSPASTIRVFGSYVLLAGFMLLIAPQMLLLPLGFADATDVWVRVLGAVTVVLGYYYHACAATAHRGLFAALVRGRLAFSVMLAGLVLAGLGPWMLLLFALIDVLCALWTWAALRRTAQVRTDER